MARPQPTFDDLSRTIELQGIITTNVRELVAHDPVTAKALLAYLGAIVGLNGHAEKPAEKQREGSSVFDRVAAVYLKNRNMPLSKSRLSTESGVSENSLHTLIYTTRPAAFHRAPNPENKREVVISLTEQAFDEVQQSGPPIDQ